MTIFFLKKIKKIKKPENDTWHVVSGVNKFFF